MILKKWQNTLNSENFLNGENVFLARDRSGSKPHILFVDHYVPQWDRDAGSRTIYHYVKLFLDSGFHVTFWPDNLHEDRVYTAQLQELGVEVLYSSAYTGKFDEWSKDNGKYFKYVFLSRPHISMSCIETVRNNFNCIVLYYGHDLHFKRILSQYEVSKDPFLLLEAERFENLELEICNRSDVVLYPSFEEINFFKERLPLKRHLISIPMNVFDEAEIISSEQLAQSFPRTNPYSLVFVGGFSHSPNVDGIIWFVEFVMPLLLKADTRFHLTIAGSNVVSSIKNLASDKISVLGYLSDNDLNELYKTSAMSIVPLRFGGGVKGKVIEAMMRGVPVAMTSIGAQGIPDADLISIVSDDAQDMAKKIIIATIDQSATALRVQKARDFIVNAYSERAAKKTLECVIPEFKLVN